MHSKEHNKQDAPAIERREVRYYYQFKDVKVGDSTIRVAPVRADIPVLKFVGIEATTNVFVIEYELRDEKASKTYSVDPVWIFQGKKSDRIGRIEVKGFEKLKIDSSTLETIRTSFNRFRTEYYETVGDKKDIGYRLKRAGRFDMIDRQIDEVSDLVSEQLESNTEQID